MEEIPLIPFGKYKGKPVTDFLADKNYVDWAKKQGLYDKLVVVNVIQQSSINQDSPTPAHNRFQNMFLEKCFVDRFVNLFTNELSKLNTLYTSEKFIKYFGESKPEMNTKVEFETLYTNWDICIKISYPKELDCKEIEDQKWLDSIVREYKLCWCQNDNKPRTYDYIVPSNFRIFCELKTTIGDEYPCILRKFKEQRSKTQSLVEQRRKTQSLVDMFDRNLYVIAFQKLTAETVTYSQLQEIFKQSDINIKIIDEDEDSIKSRLDKLQFEKTELELQLSNPLENRHSN